MVLRVWERRLRTKSPGGGGVKGETAGAPNGLSGARGVGGIESTEVDEAGEGMVGEIESDEAV